MKALPLPNWCAGDALHYRARPDGIIVYTDDQGRRRYTANHGRTWHRHAAKAAKSAKAEGVRGEDCPRCKNRACGDGHIPGAVRCPVEVRARAAGSA